MNIRPCILALAVLSLVSAACSALPLTGGPPPANAAAAVLQPPPRASDFPRGHFASASMPNLVVLSIENDGRFRIFLDSDLLDTGRFDMEGAQILVDSMVCAERGIKPASYYWLYDEEDGLTFQPVVTDPCPERRQYLSETYQPKYMFVFNVPDRGPSKEWLW